MNSYQSTVSIWDKEGGYINTGVILRQFEVDYQFRLKPKTLRAYLCYVKEFHKFIKKPIVEGSKHDIRKWLKQLIELGFKPNTVNYRITALKTFYRYCWEEGFTAKNIAEIIPYQQVEEKIPRYLSKEQLIQLRELVSEYIMERALVEVLYSTGIRISELRVMKKSDINWSERSILIPSGKGKKERIVLFNLRCAEVLTEYIESRTDDFPYAFSFGKANNPISNTSVNVRFQQYSKDLCFYVSPHVLRHTFAAHLAQKGMPLPIIQTLLGHDHIQTTRFYSRLYEHARKEMYDEWM